MQPGVLILRFFNLVTPGLKLPGPSAKQLALGSEHGLGQLEAVLPQKQSTMLPFPLSEVWSA